MNKIKILTIITKLELGGAQEVALYTADNLGENFESYFASGEIGILDKDKTKNYKNIKEFFNILTLKREINPFYDFLAFIEIIKLIKKIKPNIVHSHSSKAGILARIASFLLGVKVRIHTYHGFGFHDYQNKFKKKFLVLIERFAAKLATKLIVVSKYNIEKALKEKIGNFNQYQVIRCGIDIDKYKISKIFDEKEKFKILFNNSMISVPFNSFSEIIGMVSCLKPQKSPLDLVEIANILINIENNKNFYFFIVGDGILREKLEKKIDDYNLKNNFFLLGWRKNIELILKTFDVFVLTSIFEGLPMAVLEAMASNVPVVATGVDGTREIIKDNKNGFLVNCHDNKTFSEKIKILLFRKEIREKFIKNSKKILTEDFNKNFVIEEFKNLYSKQILNKINR